MMSLAGGAAIDIEGYAELLERVLNHLMVAVNDILRGDAFLAGTDGDGYTMLVASADEQHVLLLQSEVAHIDVGRHIDTCQVANVYAAIGVRQCSRHGCALILFLCSI